VADVNAASFSAGDSVLFKRGCTWREQLTVPSSGSSGNPITLGAYGTGDKPIINGADDITTGPWTAGEGTVAASISANAGDVFYITPAGTYSPGETWVTAGAYSTNSYNTGLCFTGLAVPQGAAITAAKITLVCGVDGTNDTVNLRIRAQTADAPAATFADAADYLARHGNLTTEYVDWSAVGHWVASSSYDTPDIANVVKEVTDRAGWVSGNNITLFVDNNGSTVPAYRQARAYESGSGYAVLSVTYSVPNVYYSTALSSDPNSVWLDGVSYPEAASAAAVNSTNRWFWSSGDTRLYVYATSDPNGFYSDIEAPVRDFALNDWNKSYHTYDGIHFRYALLSVVKMDPPGTGYIFRNCSIKGDGHRGALWINADNTIVEDCAITGGNRDGIDTLIIGSHDQYTDGVQVRRCVLRNGHHTLMSSFNARNFVIEYNDIKNEDDKWGRCIQFDDDGTYGGNIFRYNRVEGSYSGGDTGATGGNTISGINNAIYGNVFLTGTSNALQIHAHSIEGVSMPTVNIKVYSNIFYGYAGEGIRLEDHGLTTSGNLIANNVVLNCGGDPSEYENENANDLAVDILPDSTPAAYTLYNNVFYSSVTSSTIYDGTTSRTVAYMESNDPTHWFDNIVADPLFTNAAVGDFTLQAGSPCRDVGVDLGATYANALAPGSSWPSNVMTKDQRAHGAGWDIGAYLYQMAQAPLMLLRRGRR
jgi:hypothetical protein